MPVRRLGWVAHRQRSFLLGMAPALVVLALITIAPAIYLVLTSLTPLNLTLPDTAWDFSTPAGNYIDLFEDPRFTRSVWVQVKLSVATVILQLLVGLGVALLLNGGTRIRELRALGLPHPDGAAADRRRHPLAGDVARRHQPVPPLHGVHRPAGPLADHRSRTGAVGDRHRRHLGVVSLHDADGCWRRCR